MLRVASLNVNRKWAASTIGVLTAGLVLQLIGSYLVGLYGARVGAEHWLEGSLTRQIALADDPVLRELQASAEALPGSARYVDAAAQGRAAVDPLLRDHFDGEPPEAFWAWVPDDGRPAAVSDASCGQAVEGLRSSPAGGLRLLHCGDRSLLAGAVGRDPALFVGVALDDAFAQRLNRLTNTETAVFVDSTLLATTLVQDDDAAGPPIAAADLPEEDPTGAIGFSQTDLALPGYPGFEIGVTTEPLTVTPGSTWYVGTRTFAAEGITIALAVPAAFMSLGAQYNTLFMIPVSLALAIGMGMLARKLVSRYSRPVEDLLQSARCVTAGDLDHSVPVPGEPEMQELCEAHNAMLVRLRETMKLRSELAREAGRSEIATGVLHNVGNVLNGVNISVGVLDETVRASRVENLTRAASMLEEHEDDLGRFLTEDPKGKFLVPYLGTLARQLAHERDTVLGELGEVSHAVEHIKVIVATQQDYARARGLREPCRVDELLDSAVRFEAASARNHGIEVTRTGDVGDVAVDDKHRTLQILVNLVSNAKNAIAATERGHGRITLVARIDGERVRIAVADDGMGIPAENLTRIFAYGFTTSSSGHGFGLHNAANAATEMGGVLRCRSDGPGHGAVFTLELPIAGRETAVHLAA